MAGRSPVYPSIPDMPVLDQRKRISALLLTAIVAALAGTSALALDAPRYQLPPQAMIDMVDAPRIPQTALSPGNEWLLMLERASLPSVAELAQPEVRLAGLRINPRNNDQSRSGYASGIRLVRIADRGEKSVGGLPAGARIGEALWSPDGRRIAFTLVKETVVELMVAEVHNGATARRVTERGLNGVLGTPFVWSGDSKSLIANLVLQSRGAPPKAGPIAGPSVQESLPRRNAPPARQDSLTFQNLLKSAHDEALFDYYATGELASITLDGKVTVLASGLLRAFQPSPNGAYVLVQTIKRPYSYSVPVSRFPLRTEIRDARDEDAGKVIKVLSDLPLAEDEEPDPDAVRKGPRQYGWRADVPAAITWIQPVEGRRNGLGDWLQVLPAPFDGEPRTLVKLDLRHQATYWGRENAALVVESARKTRRQVVWRIFPGEPDQPPVKLFDRSTEDRYGDPGTPLLETNVRGTRVLNFSPDGRAIYLTGSGASPEGDRPFVDRFEIDLRETKRLFQSEAPNYDVPLAVLDTGATVRLLLQHENANEAPNVFLRELASGAMSQITRYAAAKNPVANASREVIRYRRRDGVELSATLYLPPGYRKEDGPLPLVMWAYPREFRSGEAAAQVTPSPYRYARPSFSNALPFLTQGYAVLDGPTMPIIAEGGREPNDLFLPQLIANAEAAVDEVVRRGVADRNRIAMGGHSYGAFMVANLLAHTRLFAAGIAESGAYNRTLTPFGFQAEERTYWKARDVYNMMSPFNFADQIKAPLLLVHGEADSNTGTFPLQSERLFQAIRGLGGTVRLVMLPYEDHAYRGRESVLHRLWEELRWLDKHVKNGGRPG